MPSPVLPAVHVTASVAESPFSSVPSAAEVSQPNIVKRSSASLVTAQPTLMSRPDYAAPLPFNPAVVARPHHYSVTSVTYSLVSRSQTFRLTAEGLEYMAAFIGQGPAMRPFDRYVKQPITVSFVQRHVSGRGNVATITDRCVKLSDVF